MKGEKIGEFVNQWDWAKEKMFPFGKFESIWETIILFCLTLFELEFKAEVEKRLLEDYKGDKGEQKK